MRGTNMQYRNMSFFNKFLFVIVLLAGLQPIWGHGDSGAYIVVLIGLFFGILLVQICAGFAFALLMGRFLKLTTVEKLYLGIVWPVTCLGATFILFIYAELQD